MSLYSSTTATARVREVSVANTTSSSVALKLTRLTTLGTAATTLTIAPEDLAYPASTCTARNSHTVSPTLGADLRSTILGAAVGAGWVWVFSGDGLVIPKDAGAPATGLGILVATGSVQPIYATIVWDE
jgi:hypothetical protein